MIGFVTWPPFLDQNYYKGAWPSDKANHTCENMLVSCHSSIVQTSLIDDFLTSADIKAFGCTYIGRADSYWPHTFYTQGVFV